MNFYKTKGNIKQEILNYLNTLNLENINEKTIEEIEDQIIWLTEDCFDGTITVYNSVEEFLKDIKRTAEGKADNLIKEYLTILTKSINKNDFLEILRKNESFICINDKLIIEIKN